MKIAIVNYPHVVKSSVIGPFDILNKTNGILDNFGYRPNRPRLQVEVLNTTSAQFHDYSPVITSGRNINSGDVYDLVIIPATFYNELERVLSTEKKLVDWIKWQYEEGAEVASICLGAFLVASSGILDGRTATTHWIGAEMFRQMFPKVKLLDDKIIIDHNRIYTCGGAYAFTSLMIYLIEKFFDHEAAVLVSKIFLINMQESQQAYTILNMQKEHGNEKIRKVQKYIEDHLNENITVEMMAEISNNSVRTFLRHFKKTTGSTPYEYLQRVRIETAKKMLENNDEGIESICMKVGYEDFSAFRKVFKRMVGETPTSYKKRYGRFSLPAFEESKKMV